MCAFADGWGGGDGLGQGGVYAKRPAQVFHAAHNSRRRPFLMQGFRFQVCATAPSLSFMSKAVMNAFGVHNIPTAFGRCDLAAPRQASGRHETVVARDFTIACTPRPPSPAPCSSFAISSDVHGSPFIASIELPKLSGRRLQAGPGNDFTIRFCKSNSDCKNSGFCAGEWGIVR